MAKVNGSNGADKLNGTDNSDDTIYGFGGSDTIYGYGGNDTIYGDVGSESTKPASVDKIIGHGTPNTYEEYAASQSGIDSLKKDFFGDSRVTISAKKLDGSEGTFSYTQYGIGVEGGFAGQLSRQGSPIVTELGYNPRAEVSESITFTLNGDFATEAWINLGKFYDNVFHDYGTEEGLVKAFLDGKPVELQAMSDGDYTVASSGGLYGVIFTANNSALSSDGKRHGNEDIGFGNVHVTGKFDTLVFSALPYKTGSESAEYKAFPKDSKPDSSDYYIQGIKLIGVTSKDSSGGGENTTPTGPFNDVIDGGAGNDVIYGNAGSDTINGNTGADKIFGDNGDDTRNGGVFDDSSNLAGDVINGDAGGDTIYGEAFHDTISGGDGADLIYGDYGDDKYSPSNWSINYYLSGKSPAFTATSVSGKPTGDDFLVGGSGRDTIFGEKGNDYINGGAGDDRLFGGAGRDTFDFNSAQMGRDVIHDFQSGVDKIDLSDAEIKNLDKDNNGIINWCDVPVFNGNMVITTEPLALYNNYILILGTTELKVSDFIFAA